MHEGDPKVRQAQLDEGRRFIDLAQKLKTPYIRVFGDKVPPGEQKRDVMARVIDGLRTLGEHAKGSGVTVLLETHGDYTDSPTVVELMKGAAMDTVGPGLGCPPHLRRRQGAAVSDVGGPEAVGAPYASEGFDSRKAARSNTC